MLDKKYRDELGKFKHLHGVRLRKKWLAHGCDTDKELHKKFCIRAGRHFGVHPKTIAFMLRTPNWIDYRPAPYLVTPPKGLLDAAQLPLNPDDMVNHKTRGLEIGDAQWARLNSQYTRGEIRKVLIKAIRKHNLPPPMQPISLKRADLAFNQLKELDSRSMVIRADIKTRWDYQYPMSNVVIDAPRIGNEASNYFHQANRWRCAHQFFPSPIDVWNDSSKLTPALNALWTMKEKGVNSSRLRAILAMRCYIASQFKPAAAKTLYELFNAKHVYDPSSGWGDRVCGFMAAKGVESYCSTDPNESLYEGYMAQMKRYGAGKKINMYCHGSEVKGGVWKKGHRVDTIFTSPPYFNTEKYSGHAGQSFSKYAKLDSWLEDFLFPTLRNCWKMLDEGKGPRGGILAMNIADTYFAGGVNVMCDPMNDFIKTLPGARYIGCVGLRLAARMNSERLKDKEGMNVEPIWVWAKGGSWELDDYIKHGFKSTSRKTLGV